MDDGTPAHRPERLPDARHLLGSFVGMAGMAATLFMVGAAVLVAPLWAVLALFVVWLVLFVLAARWFMHHPRRVAALPVLMAAIWFGAIMAGDLWLGWVA